MQADGLKKNIFLFLSLRQVSPQLPAPRRCLLAREKLVPSLWELRNRLSPVPAGAGVAYLTGLPTSGDRQRVFSAAADIRTGF